ncbi:hypothetical protein TIFTF001_025362 [Ficus carica]|uniref:Uncharacterized protein n=1 Tax=Ficus carica TaxID=3494 RepID=A0AA88AJP8_FICCA|nr:hypothetical protein TIFTF001_025362 [Ficus carica]
MPEILWPCRRTPTKELELAIGVRGGTREYGDLTKKRTGDQMEEIVEEIQLLASEEMGITHDFSQFDGGVEMEDCAGEWSSQRCGVDLVLWRERE